MEQMGIFPRITIVMPSFNQAAYLEEAICSVLDQNYPNLEFMILDGGSTDGSQEIIERYADHLTCWHSRPDKGQTDALIQGLERATGDLLGWVNSDDVLLPRMLSHVASAYVSNPGVGLLFGDYVLIDERGRIVGCKRVPRKRIGWFAQKGYWVINSQGTFFSRHVYDLVGGLNADLCYVMDADLYMRMLINGTRYQHVGHYLAGFRRHGDAKTVKGLGESRAEHYYAAERYWPPRIAKGRKQRRWQYVYWAFQIGNGNLIMFLDTLTAQGRHWKEWAERGAYAGDR